MKKQTKALRMICCLLALIVLACISTGGAYAATPDIGIDITWYDLGDYTNYNIINEKGYYILTMSNSVKNISKDIYVNAKGEIITPDPAYKPDIITYYEPIDRFYRSKELNGETVTAFVDQNETMLTGWKEFELSYLSDQLYLGCKPGDYPPGIAPPNDYAQKFALLDSHGNNLTDFKYANTGVFFNNFLVVNREYYGTAGLINQNGVEVIPTIFEDITLTGEGYAFVTLNDQTKGASRVGYFKIPESFSTAKGVRPITVYLNGTELYFASEPIMENQRVKVPMRKLFEAMGATVAWDGSIKTVTATKNGQTLQIKIGSDIAYVGGSKVKLDDAAFIKDNLTYVPLRFVSENLGADVSWDPANGRVIISD